jgi:hypothetical protein
MKPTKEFMNKIIIKLNEIAEEYYGGGSGLPVHGKAEMALMREVLSELFDEENKNSYSKRELQ